jgi:hypothetical protein
MGRVRALAGLEAPKAAVGHYAVNLHAEMPFGKQPLILGFDEPSGK